MIGENAKQPKRDNFTERAQRLNMMLHAFMLAEAAATKESPLVNKPGDLEPRTIGEARVYQMGAAPIGKNFELFLGVGDVETGFYQLPMIQVAKGIDAKVTGTIDLHGKEVRLDEQKRLSAALAEEISWSFGPEEKVRGAERSFAVALVPKTEYLGGQLLIAARGAGYAGSAEYPAEFAYYRLALNGFLSDRVFVNKKDGSDMPLLVSNDGKSERYLRLSDVVHDKTLAELEAKGVLPGVYVAAGEFVRTCDSAHGRKVRLTDRVTRLYAAGADKERPALDFPLMAEGSNAGSGLGRLGVDVGKQSSVRYEATSGFPSDVGAIFAVHFLPIEMDMDFARVQREIKKYAGGA